MPTPIDGKKTITTAGTAEKLGTSQRIQGITIQALSGNTNPVAIGASTVDVGAGRGILLAAGDAISFAPEEVDDLGDLYLDITTNGEGVGYVAITPG